MDKSAFQAMWESAPRSVAQGRGLPLVTVNLPHRSTPDLVQAALPLWLNQSVPVVVDVVDTGSRYEHLMTLRLLAESSAGKLRLHTLWPRPWSHPSEVIAMACELSQMYAETDYILFSHVDVFPHSQHLVRWLMGQCSADCPVVGYEISPRDSVTGFLSRDRADGQGREWQGMVGHSLTMVYAPMVRSSLVSWLYDESQLAARFGWGQADYAGWDTEVSFNLLLRQAGVVPKIVGHDLNREHLVDQWHGHARSYPGSLLFSHPHLADSAQWVGAEMAAIPARLKRWAR